MTDIFSHILRFHSWLLPKDYNAYPAGSIPSIRRNAIIAACLDVANLMERGGTGFQTMIESYKACPDEIQPVVSTGQGDPFLLRPLYPCRKTGKSSLYAFMGQEIGRAHV